MQIWNLITGKPVWNKTEVEKKAFFKKAFQLPDSSKGFTSSLVKL